MKLSGSYKLNVKKRIVRQALNDPNILKQCVPGCESFEKESDTIFTVTATNQIGPMNATFSGTVTLSNIQENQSYTIKGEGQSSVGFANGSADVKLTEKKWINDINIRSKCKRWRKNCSTGIQVNRWCSKKNVRLFFWTFC